MPYIPLKNGQSIFIQDEDKAQQRYQQEWGGGQPQQKVTAAPKPTAKPKAQAKPKQPQRGFDLGRFIQQAGGKAVEAVKGAAKAGATQLVAGPVAPFVQLGQQAQKLGQTKIPGTKTTVGGELRRFGAETVRQAVNAPIAAVEQLGAIGGGFRNPAAEMAGVSPAEYNLPEVEEQRLRNAEAAREALIKTGRTPEGFSYGIKPSVPILGPAFSEDSEFVQRYVKPKTALGQMAASMAAAAAFDKGVSSLLKTPSMAAKTGAALDDIWKVKDIKEGLKVGANFILKDLIPDAIQGSMFYLPELPASMKKDLDAAQKLATPEERILASQAARATSAEEFNYFYDQLINVTAGAGALTGLRSGFWAVNRFLNKATKNIPAPQAMEEALEEALPLAKQEIQADGLVKAYEQREDLLGDVTVRLYRKIDENVGKIAQAARGGAESFLTKQQEAGAEMETIFQRLDQNANLPTDTTEVDAAIAKLQGELAVKTPEQAQGKRANLQARLAEYERIMAEDPEWIRKSTGAGKKASKNATKVRNVTAALQKLDELDALTTQRRDIGLNQLEQVADLAELGRITESSFDASIGFKNALNDARILVDALDELDAERIALLEARNAQLFAENRLDEISRDYGLNDAFGEAYGELKDILNAAEAAVASENLNPEFMRTFVQRVEGIQNKVIENGGLAPTIPEMPEGLEMPPVEAVSEPPLAEGMTRLYHGSATKGRYDGKAWFSTDRQYAKDYRENAELQYVDVPTERINKLADPENYGQTPANGFTFNGEFDSADVGPRKPLPTSAAAVDEAVAIPKQEAPVQNQVPVTVDEAGEVKIDTDEIEARRTLNETIGSEPAASTVDIVKAINKERNQYQDPTETKETLDSWLKGFDDTLKKQKELIKEDEKNGTNLAEQVTEMFNSNAIKYTSSLENAVSVKAGLNLLNERDPDLLKKQYEIAIAKMATTFGEDSMWRRMGQLIEGEQFGKDVKENLHKVMIASSYLDSNAINALRAAREYRQIINDPEAPAIKRVEVLENFKNNFMVLMQNLKAIDSQFEGIGNALRLFAEGNRLQYSTDDPKVLFGEFNRQLAGFGDFAEEISNAAKQAKDELNSTLGVLFSKEDLSEQEFENITTLVDRLYQTKGDLGKLKELEITAGAVLRGVQTGGMISNPATAASIPIQGASALMFRQLGLTTSATLNAATADFLSRNPTVTAEAFRRAQLEQETLLNWRQFFGLALRSTFNSFLFSRSITDPKQAAEAAYEMPKNFSLGREQAILDDLAETKLKIPFIDYVYERSEGDDKVFDTLNNARVFAKVFHDALMPGERQQYRSWFGKWVLSPLTTGISKAQLMVGGGKASYYPAGEYVNMSLPFKVTAAGDEMLTALFANSRVQSQAIVDVDAMISMGVLNPEDRAAKIQELSNARFKEMYEPVKVGLDQKTIGNSIRDEQFMEFMRTINQTTELTGIRKNIANSLNELRYSQNPTFAAFANDLAGVVTSPLNAMKQTIMIAGGGEIIQAGTDVARLGYKNIGNALITALTPKERQKLIEFESKYFSKDLNTRIKAQGALALAVGLQAAVFFLVRDGNQDITGGLENSYREGVGKVDMFTWKIGNFRFPYRWFPPLGDVIALHATLRDMQQFGNTRGTSELVALSTGVLANYVMETPGLAGFQRAIEALELVGKGDISKLSKLLSGSFARGGDPYLNLRKVIAEGIDPRKPASPTTQFGRKGWYARNQKAMLGFTLNDALVGLSDTVVDTTLNTFGVSLETQPLRPLINRFIAIVKNEPEARSRKALWYGKPGETVSANHAGKWYPLQAVLGRYWPFPDKLEGDVVATEMVNNLAPPPKASDFHKYGISVSETTLNDFNHFMNSEFLYRDPITGKQYKGVYSYLKDFIKSPLYQSLPATDSPFKMPTFSNPANWDRSENPRRKYLVDEIRVLKDKAITQFIQGTNPGQKYKLPEDAKQYIEQRQMTGGAQ